MSHIFPVQSKAMACVMAFAFFGCTHSPSPVETPNESWGPNMVVHVGVSPSEWIINDWLAPGEEATVVVYCSSPLQCDTLNVVDGTITIAEAPGSGIGVLKVIVRDESRIVPVLRKTETMHSFIWDAADAQGLHSIEFVGDLTGWTPQTAHPLPSEPGKYAFDAVLSAGNHPYQWVIDGEWIKDPTNPNQISNGMGGWNSVVRIEPPASPDLKAVAEDGKIAVHTDGAVDLVITLDNMLIHHGTHNEAKALPLDLPNLSPGRHHLRAWAARDGGISQDLLIPLEGNQPVQEVKMLERSDWHAATMYFLMVDRFSNGNPANDEPVNDPDIHPKANHVGGDLEGVLTKVSDGYFEALGMNTVWISPVTQNAEGAWGLWQDSTRTEIKSKFSSYHGYWPVSCTKVDRRFGGQTAMNALTEGAHARGMNVVLDYVGNHVHEDHPLMSAHPDWTTDLYLPDGSLNTERWDEHRLTTWFDTFMPTLDLERPEVAEAMSDSAAWWASHSGIDGFRHDATKHISEVFWRKLTSKLKAVQQTNGKRLFQIGETYGSPDLIGSYLSSGMLDAQFDFNLYDKAVGAIAFEDGSWNDLVETNEASLAAYGAHHLMGNITGNQDRPRFTSLADRTLDVNEDMKFQGWTRDIQHGDVEGYAKMRLLMSYLMSVPGIPCVYYGDEIADVGGNDPDNRRLMRFDNLNDEEAQTRDWTSTWAALRRSRMSMLFGTTTFEIIDQDVLHIARTYLGETTHVLLNRSDQNVDLADMPKQLGTLLAGYLSNEGMLPAHGAVAYASED